MRYYVKTSVGGRPENQDASAVFPFNGREVYVLCDGMGGIGIGKEAAERVCQFIRFNLESYYKKYKENWEETVKRILFDLNNQLCRKNPKMGTTIALVYIDAELNARIAHVGDSRVYILRNKNVFFRTEDDSYVAGLVRSGRISEGEAWGHEKSNVVTNILGINLKLDVSFHSVKLEKGDKVLLSSDGLHDVVPEDEIIRTLGLPLDLTLRNALLMRKAKKAGKKKNPSNYDNITFILVDNPLISPVLNDLLRVVAIFLILAFLFNMYSGPIMQRIKGNSQAMTVQDSMDIDIKSELTYILDGMDKVANEDKQAAVYSTLCKVFPNINNCDELIILAERSNTQAGRDTLLALGRKIFYSTDMDSLVKKEDLGSLDAMDTTNILSLKDLIESN